MPPGSSASLSLDSGARSGIGDVLADESAAHEIDGSGRSVDCGDVVVSDDSRPPALKHGAAIGLPLALPHAARSGDVLHREVESADAGEEGAIAHGVLKKGSLRRHP
jgi:hypothetical protein